MRDCIIIGHRGARGLEPENTILSYQTAIQLGADMIELDVHKTKDGHLVCIHDDKVDRTTDGTGLIAEMSLKDLQQLDAGHNEHIPLLSEVLDFARNRISVNIELKVLDVEKQVIDMVQERDMKNEVIVSSFLHSTLQTIHTIDEEIKTAVLISKKQDDVVQYVQNLHSVALNPLYKLVTPELISQIHAHNIKLYSWTINEPEFMTDLAKKGVDGIITDFPNIAIKTLDQIA